MHTVLHIGSDKTGTTAVQRALASRRTELVDHGVWYPDLDGRPDHRALSADRPPILAVPSGIDTVVLSSEALWSLTGRAIERVLAVVPAGEVTVVGYVREPADHAEAAFGQRLRLSRSEAELRVLFALASVPPALNPIVGRAGRRLAQLERWAAAIGARHRSGTAARLVIRPYRPGSVPDDDRGVSAGGGAGWDVVLDLCRSVGLDRLGPVLADRADPRLNPSPTLAALHASVLVRRARGPAAQADFLDDWASGPGAVAGDQAPLPVLPPRLRRRIRQRCGPVLARLDVLAGGGLRELVDRGIDEGRIGEGGVEQRRPSTDRPARPGLDRDRAVEVLAEVWPTFPAAADEG